MPKQKIHKRMRRKDGKKPRPDDFARQVGILQRVAKKRGNVLRKLAE